MADKVLQDPSRRRLFEKDDIYSLLAVPNRRTSPATTAGFESDEEGQLHQSPLVKCVKITKKTIKKDKNYQTFAAA
jgi:hypothetical protein